MRLPVDIEMPSEVDYVALPHVEANAGVEETIVFIHGAFASGNDWSLVTPHLPQYHILCPDLPGHGVARNIRPFSVAYASELIRDLIARRARGGVAHIVGHSLGASVAMHLASNYPEAIRTVLVSGYGVSLNTGHFSPYVPYALWLSLRVEAAVPRSVTRWLMDGTDLSPLDMSICSLSLCRDICAPRSAADKWPRPWPARTLIIAASKGGLIPSNDSTADAQRLARIGQQQNAHTAAYTHPQMRHPWNRQAPLLFAATVSSWIGESSVPASFVPL